MNNNLRICTWNLCLGLTNKKNIIKNTILTNNIDICCMQETEISPDFPTELLTFMGFEIETEINDYKKRVAIYIKSGIKYKRRIDLEGENNNLIIIDILQDKPTRLMNIYRSHNPQDNINQRIKFQTQLNVMTSAITANTIILGDFNLDDAKRLRVDYPLKHMFNDLLESFNNHNLIQLINFPTWSRLITNTLKTSILDHIYTNDCTLTQNLTSITPNFGDHVLVHFDLITNKTTEIVTFKRDYRKYTKDILCNKLASIDWDLKINDVQDFWNVFECELLNIIDIIAPMSKFTNNEVKTNATPPSIKNVLNKRQRLLKKYKKTPSQDLKSKIGKLDMEVRIHFVNTKRKNVRRGIIPGNSKSLWTAVNIAKDINTHSIPSNMTLAGSEIQTKDQPEAFANFFLNKILSNNIVVEDSVYNGKRKILSPELMFMTPENIKECIKTIKVKNCEGHDRIPQRIIVDGVDYLTAPLTRLFSLIYSQNKIPQQWLMAKVNPVFKKGNKNNIENYRPISNLCSISKVFEKVILKRIMQIQTENKVDLTGVPQHGFKQAKSTATAGLIIQSIISRAIDSNNYALMASIDLSAAFDLVNIKLLIKRLHITGLPPDIVRLIELWLSHRSFYVSINGTNSMVIDLSCGIIQGSILGPILYAIYVSPLYDLLKLTTFADDNFIIRWNSCMVALIADMEKDLESMTKWLKDSGLKVNENKTEVCVFHRMDCRPITLTINQISITSLTTMNVLGVQFDTKMNWSNHVSKCIKKAKVALHAIRLIKGYFTTKELQQLITSNFYSILYYNSEIWHLPKLNPILKNHLLAASSNALKICTPSFDRSMSYATLHSVNKRATPSQMMLYKHAILLYKIYNNQHPPKDWLELNFTQLLSRRQLNFECHNNANFKVGNNIVSNRLSILNTKIPLHWLNQTLITFKLNCKSKFL